MNEFNKYKLVFTFMYDGELLKGWINETNYNNLFLEDWNALMEVVEKIDNILYTFAVNYVEGDSELDDFYELKLEGLDYVRNTTVLSCNKEEVYESVVKFIEWYNQIK